MVGCSCLVCKQTSKTLQQTAGCLLLLRQECDVSLETCLFAVPSIALVDFSGQICCSSVSALHACH